MYKIDHCISLKLHHVLKGDHNLVLIYNLCLLLSGVGCVRTKLATICDPIHSGSQGEKNKHPEERPILYKKELFTG
jgi:hypothetical protein